MQISFYIPYLKTSEEKLSRLFETTKATYSPNTEENAAKQFPKSNKFAEHSLRLLGIFIA